jgi:hypothetical protein
MKRRDTARIRLPLANTSRNQSPSATCAHEVRVTILHSRAILCKGFVWRFLRRSMTITVALALDRTSRRRAGREVAAPRLRCRELERRAVPALRSILGVPRRDSTGESRPLILSLPTDPGSFLIAPCPGNCHGVWICLDIMTCRRERAVGGCLTEADAVNDLAAGSSRLISQDRVQPVPDGLPESSRQSREPRLPRGVFPPRMQAQRGKAVYSRCGVARRASRTLHSHETSRADRMLPAADASELRPRIGSSRWRKKDGVPRTVGWKVEKQIPRNEAELLPKGLCRSRLSIHEGGQGRKTKPPSTQGGESISGPAGSLEPQRPRRQVDCEVERGSERLKGRVDGPLPPRRCSVRI